MCFDLIDVFVGFQDFELAKNKQNKTSIQWTPGSQIYFRNQKIIFDKKRLKKMNQRLGLSLICDPQRFSLNFFFNFQRPNFNSFRLLHHYVIMWYHTKRVKQTTKSKKKGVWLLLYSPIQIFPRHAVFVKC